MDCFLLIRIIKEFIMLVELRPEVIEALNL